MWIKTQGDFIINSEMVKTISATVMGTIIVSYNTPGNFDIIADYDGNVKKANDCLNKLLNALVRDDAVFVVED